MWFCMREGLDDITVSAAVNAISNADMLIVGGTSLAVYPAAGLIQYFKGQTSGTHKQIFNTS